MWTPETRSEHDRDDLRYPSDLTDAEWQVLAYSVEKVRGGVVGVVRRSNEGNVHLPIAMRARAYVRSCALK